MFVGASPLLFLPSSPIQPSSFDHLKIKLNLNLSRRSATTKSIQNIAKSPCSKGNSSRNRICLCGRRPFLATISTALIPIHHSNGSDSLADDPMAVLDRVHPPRPDWYEEFYAAAMDKTMKSYEAEIAGYKSQLFANLIGKAEKILEIGIGTGPNLKYYGSATSGASVVGVDPNRKMEKYAQAAAEASGLPRKNFKFIHAVAEALPVDDASMDAVVEVKRVLKPGGFYIFVEHVAAKDGTVLKVMQRVLDPLQQTVADGCHLTRETGDNISAAGFSNVDMKTAFLSSASLINPHAYGIACK
ncbi:methyltransferase-like protein 7A isoform X2 [Cynara cardunculus var. scolymus]|uniref:methyltransferase-like protein 7A isoform X2 n=1 Tax=Cynara cardunculus var. scolymus TaxID=59895 RepID=UPI000D626747|nr:methyltransferase-like protein 7A isoform X2 [Cynara cardunculus var. scolymus]